MVPYYISLNIYQAFYHIAEVKDQNGDPLTANDWVAAFNGDICVGSKQWNTSQCNSGICDVPVMGDNGNDYTTGYMLLDEIPTFKIYDVSENAYYDAIYDVDDTDNLKWKNNNFTTPIGLNAYETISGCLLVVYCNFDK